METLFPDRELLGPIGPKVVAFGGGHGLSATLRALRHITTSLTAVVTVADDGGSSGRLRRELGILPPGDLRMALAALCDDSQWGVTWRDALQHRFETDSELNGHALGNLLIATMWDLLDDPIEGLDWVARLLGARGRVLPLALDPMEIAANMETGSGVVEVHGQAQVATARGRVLDVWMTPSSPEVSPDVTANIRAADYLVFGPGSWYTSVIPHLLVPQVVRAATEAKARKILVMNLQAQTAETTGLTLADHIRAVRHYAPNLVFDAVLVDPSAVDDFNDLEAALADYGTHLLMRQVRVGDGSAKHDPLRLAAALRDSFDGYFSEVGIQEW